ncbi:hypothetical protein J437_LFUL014969 [Ladona fulva]|uniref:HTH CENPB-type domain-containing protein n=1 Tax=Ladona fulva TaxID=123851 RepID=A0A8K0KMD4_LADFU|nr:hypothetical protein J437_LFUL014969 [Ladona fulva]
MWVIDKRNSGVSTKMITYEAKESADKHGNQNFSGSEGWCYWFMTRHGLSMRTKTTIAQKMRPGGLLRKPSLLVWDQFRAHRTETIKNKVRELKTQIAVIPGGLTCQLQPLDVSWIGDPHHDLTPSGRMKQPSISEVCGWVKKSWEDVKAEVIVKSFKKCRISNALDGTEDDALFEGDTSDDGNSRDGDFLIFYDNEKEFFGFESD